MSSVCKNYKTDGGDKWVVGGTLKIESSAEIEGLAALDPVVIADNLTTNDGAKVLSAKQGYVLKGLVDAIDIPVLDNMEELDEEAEPALELSDVIEAFNTLMAGLKEVGLMVADSTEGGTP